MRRKVPLHYFQSKFHLYENLSHWTHRNPFKNYFRAGINFQNLDQIKKQKFFKMEFLPAYSHGLQFFGVTAYAPNTLYTLGEGYFYIAR